MDPIGFAMENFDAVGQWRDRDWRQYHRRVRRVPRRHEVRRHGRTQEGAAARSAISSSTRSAEKLLMYALGRNLQYYDAPAVRAIVREAAARKYTFSSLVLGVVKSTPFQMRTKNRT